MLKTKRVFLLSFFLGIMFTTASLASYERVDVPDLTVTKHGFPFVWLSHQTMSIAGPTNIWSFEWINLILDFAFWYLLSTVLVYAWHKIKLTSIW